MKIKIPVILFLALAWANLSIPEDAWAGPEPPALTANAGLLSMPLPAETLRNSQYSLAIDPIISPEFGLDDPVWSASAAREYWGEQSAPALAWGNDSYLLVWQEKALDPVTWLWTTSIYGARVTAGGQVLDPVGVLITPGTAARGGSPGLPAIAWDGQNYLVLWQESGGISTDAIYCARITPGGEVLDPDGILITQGPLMEREPPEPCRLSCPAPVKRPALAWNGQNYLAVWVHVYPDSATIAGARVSPGGVVLDAVPITISAGEHRGHPAVARSGDNYLVVWEQSWGAVSGYGPVLIHSPEGSWDIYGARVNSAGVVLDPAGIPISTTEGANTAPAVSSDGQTCLVVWTTKDTSTWEPQWVYGARVNPEGQVLDPANIAIQDHHWVFDPAVAWNGQNYLVLWTTDWDHAPFYVWSLAAGARVSPAGEVLASEAIVISPARDFAALPAVASNGQNWFVAWSGFGPIFRQRNSIHGARVSAAGALEDGDITAITTRKNEQSDPAVGFNGENYLVVWIDDRAGIGQVYGVRVRPDGQVLDPAAIPISDINLNLGCSRVAVSSDGEDYFVVWQASDNWPHFGFIYGARVSAAGQVLDPEGIRIVQGPGSISNDSYLAIARGASNYLVVYTSFSMISGTRVTFDGQVLETNAEHPFGWKNSFEIGRGIPSVASVGADFLVIGRTQSYLEEFSSISATRVTADGRVQPAVLLSDSSAGPAVLASDGENYLVAWSGLREPAGYDLQVARLAPTGEVLSATTVNTDATPQEPRALAWDGRNYVLAWNSGSETSRTTYGLFLSQQGEPVDPGKFTFGSNLGELTLGSGPLGECLVTYSTFDAGLGVSRVKARLLLDDQVVPPPGDTIPPVIACPPDLTVGSLRAVPQPVFTGSVSDNSDPNPVVTHVSDTAAGSKPIQITRVYQARDLAGNTATCSQIITVDLLPGDVNGDGVVNHEDLTLVLKQIHAHSNHPAYDANGDGKVDIADARFIALHFTPPGNRPGNPR